MGALSRDKMESMLGENELKPVDREKTCPLLLRVFCSTNSRHHPLSEYMRGSTPANELQIYTWKDATLKELTSLVKEVNPDARKKGTFFDFAIVYPQSANYRLREIGTTCAGKKGADDNSTLMSKHFMIGDYIDIAIAPPNNSRDGRDREPMRGRGPPSRGGERSLLRPSYMQ